MADESFGPSHTYVVHSQKPQVLAEAAEFIKGQPNVRILAEIGPPGQPHTFTVQMREDQANNLKQRFAGHLVVERDQPLSHY
jgi:hypothetical protein